jgi:putative NADH-flavin reductase
MRVLVVGAGGKTGRAVLTAAVNAGHQVTARVHSSGGDDVTGVSTLVGDAADTKTIGTATAGQDAVIDTVGGRTPYKRTTLETSIATTIIAAMRVQGVDRLIVMSVIGEGDSLANTPFTRVLLKTFLRGAKADKPRMESVVRGSGLDWIIVRPPILTEKRGTGDVGVFSVGTRDRAHSITRTTSPPSSSPNSPATPTSAKPPPSPQPMTPLDSTQHDQHVVATSWSESGLEADRFELVEGGIHSTLHRDGVDPVQLDHRTGGNPPQQFVDPETVRPVGVASQCRASMVPRHAPRQRRPAVGTAATCSSRAGIIAITVFMICQFPKSTALASAGDLHTGRIAVLPCWRARGSAQPVRLNRLFTIEGVADLWGRRSAGRGRGLPMMGVLTPPTGKTSTCSTLPSLALT